MASVFPTVPRDEWEVHLRSLNALVEDLARRVRKLEDDRGDFPATTAPALGLAVLHGALGTWREAGSPGSGEVVAQLAEVRSTCRKEIASVRQSLEAAASRLELQLEVQRRKLSVGLEEVRRLAVSEVEKLRERQDTAIAGVAEGLAKAHLDIEQLASTADPTGMHCAQADYATRTELRDAFEALRDDSISTSEKLLVVIQEIDTVKASKQDLRELKQTVKRLSMEHLALEMPKENIKSGLLTLDNSLSPSRRRTLPSPMKKDLQGVLEAVGLCPAMMGDAAAGRSSQKLPPPQ